MVARRWDCQLSIGNVAGGERETIWEDGVGNYSSENFSTVNNIKVYHVLNCWSWVYYSLTGIRKMWQEKWKESWVIYMILYIWEICILIHGNHSWTEGFQHFAGWKCCVVWLRLFMRNICGLSKLPLGRGFFWEWSQNDKLPGSQDTCLAWDLKGSHFLCLIQRGDLTLRRSLSRFFPVSLFHWAIQCCY